MWHEYWGENIQDVVVNAKADTAMNADLKDLLAAKKPAAPAPITSTAPAAPADKKSQPVGPAVVVKMISDGSAFKFEPAEITIKVGGTVKWVNDSDNRHTATDDEKFEKNAGQAILPSGAQPWGSAFLTNGESFEQKFTVPGKIVISAAITDSSEWKRLLTSYLERRGCRNEMFIPSSRGGRMYQHLLRFIDRVTEGASTKQQEMDANMAALRRIRLAFFDGRSDH